MPFVIFAAPIFNESAIRFIGATAGLPDVRLGVISQEPQEKLPDRVRAKIAAHWRVDNALDSGQLVWAAESLAHQLGPIHRFLAINEQIQVPAAEAREVLGLPGMPAEVARNFRDKARMKRLLREAGLPCARYQLVTSEAQAWAFANEVGLPLVVKPPAGAGAQATHRADTAEALAYALRQIPPGEDQPVLLEEFVTGAEFSFDTFSCNGQALWHSSTHYLPAPLEVMRTPWIQWRVLLPREADNPLYETIRPLAERALQVLGMDTGLSHLEWFRRQDGRVVISEVGTRPPGAQFTTLMSRAHDFDCPGAWARLMVYGDFDPPARQYAAGAVYLRGQGQGRVRAIHGLEQAEREVGHLVTDLKLPQIGQAPAGTYEGEGYILVRYPETAAVEQALLRLVTLVRVELG